MTIKHFAAVALLISLPSAAQGGDTKSVEGTWLPATAELGGAKFPEEVRKSMKLVIADGKYTVTVGKNPDAGTVSLDASKSPKTMDIVGTEGPNKGKTILAIYERTGDSLRICYELGGKARPTEFKTTAGTRLFLVDYQLAKP